MKGNRFKIVSLLSGDRVLEKIKADFLENLSRYAISTFFEISRQFHIFLFRNFFVTLSVQIRTVGPIESSYQKIIIIYEHLANYYI